MEARIRKTDRPAAALALGILAQGALCFVFALTRHVTFKSSGYDIGDFVQVLHNFTHGDGLTTTIAPPYVSQPWLAVHFSPILYLLAPLYAALPHAETLLFVHCFCLAGAAWPLFFALKRAGCNDAQALVLALFYLINPFVLNAAVWEFHEIAFAPLLISTAMWALLAKNRRAFLLSCLLLFMVKEHYGLGVCGLGLFWVCLHRDGRFGYCVAAAGFAAFVLVLFWLMPALSPAAHHFMTQGNSLNNRYGWLTHAMPGGMTMPRVLALMLVQNVFYAWLLLMPWLLLPVFSPLWLLPGLADLVANGLSLHSIMRSPLAYHNAALIPVLALATGHVLVARKMQPAVLGLTGVMALCMSYAFLPLPAPGAANVWELGAPRLSLSLTDYEALSDIEALIPPEDALASQNNVLAHIAARREAYHFPETENEGGARWLVLRLRFPYHAQEDMFGATYSVKPDLFMQELKKKLSGHAWGIAYFRHGWLVLERAHPDAKGLRPGVLLVVEHLAACHEAVELRRKGKPLPSSAANCE